MKPKIYAIAVLILFYSNAHAQTPLPYFTGFDNAAQQAGWQHFRKGSTANSDWSYPAFNAFSAPNALSHFYPVGGTIPTDDWFVSPVFDFSAGGRIDSIRHNFSGFGTPFGGDSIAVFLLNGSPNPDLAASKILLFDYTINYVHDNIWHLDTNMIIPATAGQSYIALQYKTIINWLDVIFDNIRISGNGSTGVALVTASENDFQMYPNPVNQFLKISKTISENSIIAITDISGKNLRTFLPAEVNPEKQIDISELNAGIYFLKMTNNNSFSVKKFVKQ
jgi:hypothetical protein